MLEQFTFHYPIQIRWADIDALNHVNNAVYLSYFEQARIDYFRAAVNWNWEEVGMILAKSCIEYYKPLLARDQAEVWLRVSKLGNKSFEMENKVVRATSDGPEIVTFCTSTIVTYDYRNERTVAIPAHVRAAVLAREKATSVIC
jgi:acyl-CoA thioester hydrolase